MLDVSRARETHAGRDPATHHHPDHVGGIAGILEQFRVPVYRPAKRAHPNPHAPVSEGDRVKIPELGASFSVLDIPGHTRAHIAYYGAGSLFCGDTLFACGCGRVFEGTPEQMYASLEKLLALPDETKVYCGHEYTLANIGFAKAVEPGNAALSARERATPTCGKEPADAALDPGARKKPPTLFCVAPSRP